MRRDEMTEAVPATGAGTQRLRAARDFLLETREDYERAYREFRWPQLETFNWALDWFDVLAAEGGGRDARRRGRRASRAVDRGGGRRRADVHVRGPLGT